MFKIIKLHISIPRLFILVSVFHLIACVETVSVPQEVPSTIAMVPTSYVPTLLQELDEELAESSGLVYFGGKVWTVNDSGNENIVYQVNLQTGKAERKVRVTNSENIDWESLAHSERHLYIGDFGNNSGTRTDLAVLKIRKEDLINKTEVTAEKIFFSYPEQENFEERTNSHNFDCEAFFYSDGELHLFTKNWENNHSDHYTLGTNPGKIEAKYQGSFDTEGLITGADINTSTGDIVLIGYENSGIFSQSFIWLLSDYPKHNLWEGKNSRITIGSPGNLGQTEAIFINNDNTGYISSEAIEMDNFHIKGKLFSLNFQGFL